jgi:hypothetical protein
MTTPSRGSSDTGAASGSGSTSGAGTGTNGASE